MTEEEVVQLAKAAAMAPVEARRLSRLIAEQRIVNIPESKRSAA
jgi:hypothetical protein